MSFIDKLFGRRRTSAAQAPVVPVEDWMNAPTFLNFASFHDRALKEDFHRDPAFPHVCIDQLLGGEQLALIGDELSAEDRQWAPLVSRSDVSGSCSELVLTLTDIDAPGSALRELLWELHSGTFMRKLENYADFDGLIADPHLREGGLRRASRGSTLDLTPASGRGELAGLEQRLGIVVFLSADWDEDWGGEIELWSEDGSNCVGRIAPLPGRCLVFGTLPPSLRYAPLTCPDEKRLLFLVLYCYGVGGEADVVPAGKT